MSRTDLTGVNAAIITAVGEGIRQNAPNAVVVVVDQSARGNDPFDGEGHRLPPGAGLGHGRRSGRRPIPSLIALTGVARPQDVSAIALGSHGPEMVIPLSQATVNGAPLAGFLPAAEIDAIVERAGMRERRW